MVDLTVSMFVTVSMLGITEPNRDPEKRRGFKARHLCILAAIMLGGCIVSPANPSASIQHPANPDAAEAPIHARPGTLATQPEGAQP
jgi:hypothetical protein